MTMITKVSLVQHKRRAMRAMNKKMRPSRKDKIILQWKNAFMTFQWKWQFNVFIINNNSTYLNRILKLSMINHSNSSKWNEFHKDNRKKNFGFTLCCWISTLESVLNFILYFSKLHYHKTKKLINIQIYLTII